MYMISSKILQPNLMPSLEIKYMMRNLYGISLIKELDETLCD